MIDVKKNTFKMFYLKINKKIFDSYESNKQRLKMK